MKPKILISGNKKIQNYANAIERVGGVGIAEYLPEISVDYDGLVLCGGNDTDPAYYGEEVNGAKNFDLERDKVEFALTDAFVKAKKPILAICRGCQLINIYFGGNLYQHIDNYKQHYSGTSEDLVHGAKGVKGGFLETLYGESFFINSYHHQAIKKLGNGLKVTAYSDDMSVIEGIAHKDLPIIATQFHPERMCFDNKRDDAVDGSLIFEYFIKMCKGEI